MVRNYLTGALSVSETPQSEPIPGSNQVANSAGGYSFAVDDFTRLRRFLILGSEGGSYYASERKLTKENAETAMRCIRQDGQRVVSEVVAISDAGRAPKNDPALFVLALAARQGDLETRKAAFRALPKVARIGTHLFHFAAFMESIGGEKGGKWSVLARRGVASWYEDRSIESLADQAIKYQQRDGWGHADLIRLSHPRGYFTSEREAIYRYMSYGMQPDSALPGRGKHAKGYMRYEAFGDVVAEAHTLRVLRGTEAIKSALNAGEAARLIETFDLPREVVPTQFLDSKVVWAALLPHMGITAILRNLAKMTSIDMFNPPSAWLDIVLERITDQEGLRRGRVHPIAILIALMTYRQGHGVKGSLTWEPKSSIIDALDRAFYLSFGNVEPSGVAWEMWLDVSGSMGGGDVAGVPGFTPRIAAAAFSLVNASVERQCEFYGFAQSPMKLTISPRQRLDDVIQATSHIPFGGTDCSLPMVHALEHKRYVDTFCVLTDSETWYGTIHPVQALAKYRRAVNPTARLIVCAMVPNQFSIADPNDAGMLDVVGFDTAAPQVMSDFAVGRL